MTNYEERPPGFHHPVGKGPKTPSGSREEMIAEAKRVYDLRSARARKRCEAAIAAASSPIRPGNPAAERPLHEDGGRVHAEHRAVAQVSFAPGRASVATSLFGSGSTNEGGPMPEDEQEGKRRPFLLRLDEDLYEDLREESDRTGYSMADIARDALREKLDKSRA